MIKPCAGWDDVTVENGNGLWAQMSTCWRCRGRIVEFHVHRETTELSYRKFEVKP